MINLVGLSQSEAENQLAKLKLKIGQVTAEYSDKPSGTVLKQSISANNKVKKGANIDIVISKGKEVKSICTKCSWTICRFCKSYARSARI